MKWTKDEENLILKLSISGKSYKEISLIINRNESSIRGKFFKLGKKSSTYYKAKKIKTKCKECDKELFELISRKVENRPSLDILVKEVKEYGYSEIGRKYGVSDNSIRKWIK